MLIVSYKEGTAPIEKYPLKTLALVRSNSYKTRANCALIVTFGHRQIDNLGVKVIIYIDI
jgi:hypothetical protein